MNEIAVLQTRPIIDYSKMAEVGLKVQERLSQYDFENLVVTDENVKEIKELRTTLRKEFDLAEATRKAIKDQVNEPYTKFEESFKDHIAKHYKDADVKLKNAIDKVEDEIKKQKENLVRSFFNELVTKHELDFLNFEMMKLNVTLSSSLKSLKEEADNFIRMVLSDISLINSQEHQERIIVEYKRSLNVSQAIQKVLADVKQEQALIERRSQAQVEKEKVIDGSEVKEEVKDQVLDQGIKVLNTEEVNKIIEEVVEILTVSFTIKDTRSNIIKVREFMKKEGIKYE